MGVGLHRLERAEQDLLPGHHDVQQPGRCHRLPRRAALPGSAGAPEPEVRAPAMAEPERSGELAAMVGRKLHGLRLQRELTLEQLARLSGVSRAMLWQIEQARSAPTITVLARVAEALGMPVGAFLDAAVPAVAVVLRRGDASV